MKNVFYILLLGAVWSSCSNDFEVTAPWKEVPIVYGVLSPRDTAHYIRVEKAFLGPSTSADVIAKIADSLYYPEAAIAVWLERPGTTFRVPLTRVDGNLEGHVRETGTFADSPNWLYKFKGSALTPGGLYRLVVERADGKPNITAETTIPKDFTITNPDPTNIVRKVTFTYSETTTVDWRTDEYGVYFNVFLILPYREEAPDGTTLLRDTLIWRGANNVERSGSQVGAGVYKGTTELPGAQFFRFLSESLQPTTNFRYFEKCSILLEGGGKEIKEFNITASANSGLTGAEVYPTYTNVTNGLGVFSAKNEFRLNNVQISQKTIDSLQIHPLTQALKFRI